MRTMFTITRGVFAPESFRWVEPPPILTISDLWEYSRTSPPGMLLRVRTNAEPEQSLQAGDKIESVIGLIDSTTRWRAALAILRGHLAAVRNKALQQVVWNVFGMMMQKHPATIMQPERQSAVEALAGAVESLPKELMQSVFEQEIVAGLAQFVMADNDIDAAMIVPLRRAMALNVDTKSREVVGQRIATLDVLASSVLMTEAYARLAERAPEWLYVPAPGVSFGDVQQTTALREPEVEADNDSDEDEDED